MNWVVAFAAVLFAVVTLCQTDAKTEDRRHRERGKLFFPPSYSYVARYWVRQQTTGHL
jgi:hypothetical protein